LVDVEAVKAAKFKVVVDGVNSSGGIPKLLELIVEVEIIVNPTDIFHTIQSLKKEHLTDISELVVKEKADLGVVVDPDVDRLAFICEDGEMFGEEYTLVACADYVLSKTQGTRYLICLLSCIARCD
jgi:phosphomannomutase